MPTPPDRNSAADPRSGGERLDVERCGRTGERRILGRKRQTQPHGQLEVARIVTREASLTREWQYVSKRAPWEVRVDAYVEIPQSAVVPGLTPVVHSGLSRLRNADRGAAQDEERAEEVITFTRPDITDHPVRLDSRGRFGDEQGIRRAVLKTSER